MPQKAVASCLPILLVLTNLAPAQHTEQSLNNVPATFTRFSFAGNEREAELLNNYLWHHFSNRIDIGIPMFNMEYLTHADMWLNNAVLPSEDRLVQKRHRQILLEASINPEGYVWSHQHFSSAYDPGWPFPLWSQAMPSHQGRTAGWHFAEEGDTLIWHIALLQWGDTPFSGNRAVAAWKTESLRSHGIVGDKWRLKASGYSPMLTSPPDVFIDAFECPFLQIRWRRTPQRESASLPYVEWLRNQDQEFSKERRVYFTEGDGTSDHEQETGTRHSIINMHRHPRWEGKIKRFRIALAPGEKDVTFEIHSIFTAYDTRHTINNPIYILSCWNYFRWTGDLDFLHQVLERMRLALRYQQTVMGGLKNNHIRNPWPGHDGRAGSSVDENGKRDFHSGHGIGSNYWDLLPFGWDDTYATSQYHAATLVMAEVEEAIRNHPEWGMPLGAQALDPTFLREHATEVRATSNDKFWNDVTGRFVACIDEDGQIRDYGYTFVNLEAIWYGLANETRANTLMDWITGQRIVEGDTSTGEDIYRWRFGPRASTRRNVDWYQFVWTTPEQIPWGGQVQDGGGVLGFTFYDLWARLRVIGPDDAWTRLQAILDWEEDVRTEGGYRQYYENGKGGTTLQGGGPAGGIGIDNEFLESSLLPSIIVYGFMGLTPRANSLKISPKLPAACPKMTVRNLLYRGGLLDITTGKEEIVVSIRKLAEGRTVRVMLPTGWGRAAKPDQEGPFVLNTEGNFHFIAGAKR